MELYHALPFFCYLLGKALCDDPNDRWLRKVTYLGVTVLGTFVLCWLPFLDSWTHAQQVFHRLFPLSRGLYEDKVANVWCSLALLFKMKKLFSVMALVRITSVTTIVAMIPSSWNLIRNPTPYRFVLALVSGCMYTYMYTLTSSHLHPSPSHPPIHTGQLFPHFLSLLLPSAREVYPPHNPPRITPHTSPPTHHHLVPAACSLQYVSPGNQGWAVSILLGSVRTVLPVLPHLLSCPEISATCQDDCEAFYYTVCSYLCMDPHMHVHTHTAHTM